MIAFIVAAAAGSIAASPENRECGTYLEYRFDKLLIRAELPASFARNPNPVSMW